VRKVWSTGLVGYEGMGVMLGRRWAGARVQIVAVGQLLHVYYGEELLRTVALDRSRRYQTLGIRRRREAVNADNS